MIASASSYSDQTCGRNAPVVGVEQQRRGVAARLAVAGEMEFADRLGRQRAQIALRIPAVIGRADEDVVDVADQPAAGALHQRAEKLRFGNRRMAELQIGRRVFHQDGPPERVLDFGDVAADHVEAFLGQRQRQQIGEKIVIDRAPGQMFGDQSRLDALGERRERGQVPPVDSLGGAERQSDAVQRNRVMRAHLFEHGKARLAQVVFAVHFHPADRRQGLEQRADDGVRAARSPQRRGSRLRAGRRRSKLRPWPSRLALGWA